MIGDEYEVNSACDVRCISVGLFASNKTYSERLCGLSKNQSNSWIFSNVLCSLCFRFYFSM